MSKTENQKPLWAACLCRPVVYIQFPQDCFYPPPQQISVFVFSSEFSRLRKRRSSALGMQQPVGLPDRG